MQDPGIKGVSMSYTATVIPVMIASPSDVLSERNIARQIIGDWNDVNSMAAKTILTSVGWDSHASPDLGGRPQKLINERILKDCDLLVGIFWTRLGTPTGEFESGTVEEIRTHLATGKPAMVFFSNVPVAPQSLDAKQYDELQKFRTWCQTAGLISTYDNLPDFEKKFAKGLQIHLATHPYLEGLRRRAESDGSQALPISAIRPTLNVNGLSDEAIELLKEAAQDDSGMILKVEYLSGAHIETHGKQYGVESHRVFVRWEHALQQLISEDYVVARGHQGQVFELTDSGYRLADQLK